MFKQSILILYKNGTSISIEVPENYYANKYKKKPEKKLHQLFIKDYKKFVKILNKNLSVVDVGNYLKFSNASICGKDVLSVDIKTIDINDDVTEVENTTFIPGLHDQTYLNLKDTPLEEILQQMKDTDFIPNMNKLIEKLLSFFNKSNVEFTIKAGSKKSTSNGSGTTKKKSTSSVTANVNDVPSVTLIEEQSTVNNK